MREDDWFYDAAAYVCSRKLMRGTTDKVFSSGKEIARGMIVAILLRLEECPAAAESAVFFGCRVWDVVRRDL